MHFVIFGVGAVGGYFGGRLAMAGEQVTFIARGETLKALQTDGLTLVTPGGTHSIRVNATSELPSSSSPDVVILGVKAWQVKEAAAALRAAIGPKTIVLPLQNGVEASEQLASVLGRDHVVGGLCRIAAKKLNASTVVQASGLLPTIVTGELDNHQSQRVTELAACLNRAGVRAELAPDINVALWQKFAFIAPFSGVGAVTRSPAGVMRSVPETRAMLEHAIAEVIAVAHGRGVRLPNDTVQKTLQFVDALPADTTASMQRDIIEGRPSELESQTGAIVRLGREASIATPVNDVIYVSLLPAEVAARKR